MSKSTDEIIALERRLWTESDNPATLGEIVLDEAITVIEPMGFITKQQAIGMPAEHPWRDVQMTDIVAHQVTDDCVTLAYHGQGRQEGRDEPYRGSIASVYVRRDGRWQLALTAHQPWNHRNRPLSRRQLPAAQASVGCQHLVGVVQPPL